LTPDTIIVHDADMATVTEMIEALGGIRKSAAVLGVPPTTVQHWKAQDRVPAWREEALRDAYLKVAA
jgi:hypothetical protein